MLKKLASMALAVVVIMGMGTTVFASEQTPPLPPINSDGSFEITEEYIEQYGIRAVDEFGNEIIEVPLGPDMSNISDPLTTDNEVHEGVHEGHSYPEGITAVPF